VTGDPAADQAENLLGALGLAIVDRVQADTDATALSALHQFLDAPTIDLLRQVLGLTSSGTVRLVDRLAAEGYVRRGAGADRRATTVSLTSAGRLAARRAARDRRAVLSQAMAALDTDERRQFGELAGKILAGLVRSKQTTERWTCRQCDLTACGHRQGRCPVAAAGAAREWRWVP